jgi:hypothetical protein
MYTYLSVRAAFARRIARTLCFVAAATYMSIAHAGDLHVMVRTATGIPADAATVCVGTPQRPTQYGSVKTNSSGVAVLRNVPAGIVQVTAHVGPLGETLMHQVESVPQQSISVRLPLTMTNKTCGATAGGSVPGASLPETPQPPDPTTFRLGDAPRPAGQPDLQVQSPRVSLKTEYCFGALGAQCGGAQHNLPTTALCAAGLCQINAGSWEHDECCFANPKGLACQVGPADYLTGHDGKCVNEWNKALARLAAGLNWTRRVDFNRPNTTGRVEFSLYCAETGVRVHQEDIRYCCSRQADPAPLLPGLPAIAGSQVRVCR